MTMHTFVLPSAGLVVDEATLLLSSPLPGAPWGKLLAPGGAVAPVGSQRRFP